MFSALGTPLALIGGVFAGAALASVVQGGLPGHISESDKAAIAAVPAVIGFFAGGALWGAVMARITSVRARKRMVWAGALSMGPTILAVGIGLAVLEGIFVERAEGPLLPIHVIFTMLFVPATALTAGVGGLALGIAQRDTSLAARLALFSALAGGLAFLVVALTMDALGYRVGAPGAAERFTMVTVALLGILSAAIAGGAIIGSLLSPSPRHADSPSAVPSPEQIRG